MACIMILQVLLGILICKTQYGALYSIPIGVLTGILFGLIDYECSKKK